MVGVSRTEQALRETISLLQEDGFDGDYAAADISSEAGARMAFETALKAHGRVDILVNAAGVGYSWLQKSPQSMDAIHSLPLDKWDEVMRINLTSCFLMSKLAVVQMRKQGTGGSIVNVSSVSGFRGLTDAHAYCASKGGMINLTNAMSCAYAAENIRSNCVAPGYIDTGMIELVKDKFEDPVAADLASPMKRPGTPVEIANGCLFFASDEASYCSGSVLVIDGGMTARQG